MIVIMGLGNPGIKYAATPHNVGFMVLDKFQKEHSFPDFKLSKKHSSLISEGFLRQAKDILSLSKVVLAKPQTFMNNSGKAVKALLPKLLLPKLSLGVPKLSLGKTKPILAVVHDDIDIPLGEIKVSTNRGSAGHKGVESIIQALGTKNFTRIRIGIQPAKGKPENVEKFVLQKFTTTELPLLQSAIQQTTEALVSLVH